MLYLLNKPSRKSILQCSFFVTIKYIGERYNAELKGIFENTALSLESAAIITYLLKTVAQLPQLILCFLFLSLSTLIRAREVVHRNHTQRKLR